MSFKIRYRQESPPAWTQEAYRPPCSKYTLCCSSWGYPLPRFGWGVVPPSPSRPEKEYPPVRTGQGYPPSGRMGVPSPGSQMGINPPSPRNVNRHIPVKSVPSLILRMRPVTITLKNDIISNHVSWSLIHQHFHFISKARSKTAFLKVGSWSVSHREKTIG